MAKAATMPASRGPLTPCGPPTHSSPTTVAPSTVACCPTRAASTRRARYAPSMPDPDEFDAIAAAKELDELLAQPSDAKNDIYIASLEADIQALNALLAKKEALVAQANERA